MGIMTSTLKGILDNHYVPSKRDRMSYNQLPIYDRWPKACEHLLQLRDELPFGATVHIQYGPETEGLFDVSDYDVGQFFDIEHMYHEAPLPIVGTPYKVVTLIMHIHNAFRLEGAPLPWYPLIGQAHENPRNAITPGTRLELSTRKYEWMCALHPRASIYSKRDPEGGVTFSAPELVAIYP